MGNNQDNTCQRDIINRIKNSDNWPEPKRSNFLGILNDVADKAFNQNSIDGYLSSIIIYHQLTEELIKILIDCSEFYIQLSVFPQKLKKRSLKNKMFGQLLEELKHCVSNDYTTKFIKLSQKLNSFRIGIVHKLTLNSSLIDVKEQCKRSKDVFDSIFELFEEIYDDYRVTFKDFKKYPEELEEMLE